MAKTLKELLAEKKAAAQSQAPTPTSAPVVEAAKEVVATTAAMLVDPAAPNTEQTAISVHDPKLAEQPEAKANTASWEQQQPKKPMSFAEMMAAKRAGDTKPTTPSSATSSLEDGKTLPVVLDKEEALRTGTIDPALDPHPPILPATSTEADPVVSQAYADIKDKIEHLESLEDTALEGAMKELKKALMANPNAVSLMLDTDIGQMVIALRRLTREAQVEASKEKTGGRSKKTKDVILTAEAMSEVFDDL